MMNEKIAELIKKKENHYDTRVLRVYYGEGSSSSKFEELIDLHTKVYSDQGFRAYLEGVDNELLDGFTREDLLEYIDSYPVKQDGMCFFADKRSFEDNTLVCVNLQDDGEERDPPAKTSFRVRPEDIWSPQNNLSIANCSFEEMLETCDEDGILLPQ